jgi:hypothetical protein
MKSGQTNKRDHLRQPGRVNSLHAPAGELARRPARVTSAAIAEWKSVHSNPRWLRGGVLHAGDAEPICLPAPTREGIRRVR